MEKYKIKIMYVITRFICGGAQKVVLSLATRLDREKYQVTVVCGELPDSEKDCESMLVDKGVKLISIKQLVRNISIINDAIVLLRLYLLIRKENFYIVHTFTSKAGAIGRLAAFFARVPIIINVPLGNIFEPKGKIPGVSDKPLVRLSFLFIERALAKFTDKIITISEDEKFKYTKLKIDKADKFITIYGGIDCNEFLSCKVNIKKEDFGFQGSDFIVGSVGRLDPEKGHIYLIEAAAIVSKENPRVKFLIIGDGTSRKKLEDYATHLGISNSIRFLGLRKDISELLSIMDVFVLPSLYEGFGIAVLEAMAMSLPVIATKVGGVPEVIIDGETGILVPPQDSKAIADSIIFLLKNREKARVLGDNARKRVEKYFNLNSTVERIKKLYDDLIYFKNSVRHYE